MTIQKKIMFSNIVATTITALMICIICVAYVHFHSETIFTARRFRMRSGNLQEASTN